MIFIRKHSGRNEQKMEFVTRTQSEPYTSTHFTAARR